MDISLPPPIITDPLVKAPYPGLSQEDTDLATRYLRTRRGLYRQLMWDWCIGEAWKDIPKDMQTQYLRAAIRGSALRMDLVGVPVDDGPWHLIEFRANAGTGAIGAIICYRSLWPAEAQPAPRCVIVTDYIRRDIRAVAQKHDIEIIAV